MTSLFVCLMFSSNRSHSELTIEREGHLNKAKLVATALRDSENYYDQIAGAGTLVEFGDKDALQFLADNLSHTDWVLMRSAIDTLISVRHPSGVDVIYKAAETIKETVFLKFLTESLSFKARDDMGEFLVDLLEEEDQWVKKHAMQAIDFIDFSGKKALLKELVESEKSDPVVRAYASMALITSDSSSEDVERLIRMAKEGDSSEQEAAAVALGRIGSEESREVLRTLRNSRYPKVSIAALASEVGLGIQDAKERLIAIITNGKGLDPSVAAASLRRMPVKVADQLTKELIACCELTSDVGTRVLEAWSNISEIPAHIYEWGLENSNPDIKLQGIWLVGQTDAYKYLSNVVGAMDDNDPGIRGMAAWSTVMLLQQ